MDKIFSSWKSLQSREQFIVKILLTVLMIGLLSLFFSNVLGSVGQNQQTLAVKKIEFNYVLRQAERIQSFVSSRQLALDSQNPAEFLLIKSAEFGLVNYRLVKENEQNSIYFSDNSIGNISQFLNAISAHPSISLFRISISPTTNKFELKVVLDLKQPKS